MAEKIAVYPGTFDPMTLGHFDLIRRAAALYPRLVVAVAATSVKSGAMFEADVRMAMIREDVKKAGLKNVSVAKLDTLLVDFCRARKARVVIRAHQPQDGAGDRDAVHDAERKPGLRVVVDGTGDCPLWR